MEERNLPLKAKERADHRLKKNKHFTFIYRKGKKNFSKHLTLFSVPSKFKTYRFGISVSKKIGKANIRNKLKRRIKEIVRVEKLPREYQNYIIMAREGAAELDFYELKKRSCISI